MWHCCDVTPCGPDDALGYYFFDSSEKTPADYKKFFPQSSYFAFEPMDTPSDRKSGRANYLSIITARRGSLSESDARFLYSHDMMGSQASQYVPRTFVLAANPHELDLLVCDTIYRIDTNTQHHFEAVNRQQYVADLELIAKATEQARTGNSAALLELPAFEQLRVWSTSHARLSFDNNTEFWFSGDKQGAPDLRLTRN